MILIINSSTYSNNAKENRVVVGKVGRGGPKYRSASKIGCLSTTGFALYIKAASPAP